MTGIYNNIRHKMRELSRHDNLQPADPEGYSNRYRYKRNDQSAWSTDVIVIKGNQRPEKFPDLAIECHFFAEDLFRTACSLLAKSTLSEQDKKKNAAILRELINVYKKNPGILFDKVKQTRQKLIDSVCALTGASTKELEEEGYRLRGKYRHSICYIWPDPITQKDCFMVFEPIGRYTDEQLQLKQKRGEELPQPQAASESKRSDLSDATKIAARADFTSSHQKKSWEGVSNCLAVTSGTLDEKGEVDKILYQGAVRGALPTYKDYAKKGKFLKGQNPLRADPLTRWEILARAVRSQKEFITALAQIKLEQQVAMTEEDPQALAQKYTEQKPFAVQETYVQIVSPAQWFDEFMGEYQEMQFHDTRRALEIVTSLDSLEVNIQLNNQQEEKIHIKPRSAHFCFGINNFWRHLTTEEQDKQNARAMNDFYDDFIKALDYEIKGEHGIIKNITDAKLQAGFAALVTNFKAINNNQENINIAKEITSLTAMLVTLNKKMDGLLKQFSHADGKQKIAISKKLAEQEKLIMQTQAGFFALHQQLEKNRKNAWKIAKKGLADNLALLKVDIARVIKTEPTQKKSLHAVFNLMSRFADIQSLYYPATWKQAKNNILLQSLIKEQAQDMGCVATSSCKSTNDRNIALVNTVVTQTFQHELAGDGSYQNKSQFYNASWTERGKKVFDGVASQHHKENTGVSGGKFNGPNAGPHEGRKELGKIASWVKVKLPFYKNPRFKKAAWAIFAITAGIGLCFTVIGAHLGIAMIAKGVAALSSYIGIHALGIKIAGLMAGLYLALSSSKTLYSMKNYLRDLREQLLARFDGVPSGSSQGKILAATRPSAPGVISDKTQTPAQMAEAALSMSVTSSPVHSGAAVAAEAGQAASAGASAGSALDASDIVARPSLSS